MIYNNDTFISDDETGEEDLCPLCVEEMDLSDKNFKPCPCGYQICQFCYNNIRQNPDLNGRCPACRRQYDDESVEYKQLTAEEWKLEQSKLNKKDKDRKQKEKEKKEHEQLNRKHLAGMRVIQKNLVYIVGLNPLVSPEDLHTVLRSDKYFGQFGRILKIVVNKRNPTTGHFTNNGVGVGVYVTFSKKEEAAKCISQVDGAYMDGKQLKAAFGTTKYCSSYLRGQTCPNPNCMFLHEPGEEADSYTRQDLSTRQSLKMGGLEALKMQAPFPSNQGYTEDIHSGSNISSPATNSNTPLAGASSLAHSLAASAPLPANISWASNPVNISPPDEETEILTNSTAFPTLGESLSLHQQSQQQQNNHQPQQTQKKNKNQNPQVDEFNPEEAAACFIDEIVGELKSAPPMKFNIRASALNESVMSYPPLFAYKPTNQTTRSDRAFNLRLVKSLIAKTSRPPVMAPPQQFPPTSAPTQSQSLPPQSQTPSQQHLQLNDFMQQQRANSQPPQLPPQHQQQQFFQQQQQNSVAQVLLQQQLLQQQAAAAAQAHTPSEQHPQQSSAAQHLLHEQLLQQNKGERPFSATPPPGMFAPTQQNGEHGMSGTASELLNHLMNGKKISA